MMTIKEVVIRTGLSISTLHYYEDIGLLDPIERADNGHRRYHADDLQRIEFLKRLRAIGMPIRDMRYYVALYRDGAPTLQERLHILEKQRANVQAQIASLTDTLDFLDTKIARYRRELHDTSFASTPTEER